MITPEPAASRQTSQGGAGKLGTARRFLERLSRKRPERKEERVAARHPVFLEHGRGMTRDISRSGAFFETGETLELGGTIRFAIDFETEPSGPFRLLCEATVVRVETSHGHHGVGAAITSARIRSL